MKRRHGEYGGQETMPWKSEICPCNPHYLCAVGLDNKLQRFSGNSCSKQADSWDRIDRDGHFLQFNFLSERKELVMVATRLNNRSEHVWAMACPRRRRLRVHSSRRHYSLLLCPNTQEWNVNWYCQHVAVTEK